MHSERLLLATYSAVHEIYWARKMRQVFLVWPLTLGIIVNVDKIFFYGRTNTLIPNLEHLQQLPLK